MIRPLVLLHCLAAICLYAEDAAWSPSAMVEGVAYRSVDELRGFYKLNPNAKATRKDAYALNLDDLKVEFGPGRRDLSIGGIRIELSHALQKDAQGNLLIARTDWIKWIDPIMRPTYISGRAAVRTVVIDPGHGGHDPGTPSQYVKEADATLQVALRLQEELTKQGFQVVLTRSGDYFLSDRQRVDIANAADSAIFISLHLNSGRSDYHGVQVYTAAPAEPGNSPAPSHAHDEAQSALAYALQSALVSGTGAADGGCSRAHYSLLSSISCPAVWVELGYATHAQEGASLASAAYRDALAQALAHGIATYAKVADPATGIPVQPKPVAAPKPPPARPVTTPTRQTTQRSSSGRSGSTSRGSSSSSRGSSSSSTRSSATQPRRATPQPQQSSRATQPRRTTPQPQQSPQRSNRRR